MIKNAPIPSSLPPHVIDSHQIPPPLLLPRRTLAHFIQYLPRILTPSPVATMLVVPWLAAAVANLTISIEVVRWT